MLDEYQHDDFEVVREDTRFGGFEELKLRRENSAHTRFFRKAITPENNDEFDDLMELEKRVMKDGCSGALYPMYTRNGRRWALMSVPAENYTSTGLSP
ncbi:hypothetical protein EDD17DRAFT_1659331 [Pisolithus thermaeus]|nr:hypothetical protein EV401DRAFT_2064003 [Pisolithus croceorrhizus]KAI6143555.1 hypothetical protein EDD17DRAFT_1659331 [Pisolithus thermaeus]